jgi:hypothetical protein
MEKIPNLYDNINLNTIPECILDELSKYSDIYSSHSVRGVDGKFVTTYGKTTLPVFAQFDNNGFNFYVLDRYLKSLRKYFGMTTILKENGEVLEYDKLPDYYKSYGEGFRKGYDECENLFQSNSSLFKKTSEAIAFDVYSRVINPKYNSAFSFSTPFNLDEVQRFSWVKNESRFSPNKKRLNFPFILSLKGCFDKGYNGGVFYKCWSIILNNPLLFESFFLEQKETAEPEPLDLSDTSTVEKKIIIIKEPYSEMFSNNGFELFEHILIEYVKPKNTTGRYEDLSYHYRCLFEDKFIHQKPEPFRLWFIEKYTDEFSKIKTKTQTTSPQRKKDYSTALDWFNRQN